MATTNLFSETKRIVGIVLFFLIYIVANAQEQPAIKNSTTVIKDANIGYFIIGGILGFGIIGYLTVTIIEKYRKRNEKPPIKTIKTSHSRHHHIKVVKKSA